MNTMRALPLLTFALTMLSCGGGTKSGVDGDTGASGSVQRIVKEVSITAGTPVTIADLSIEGMSCAMMCGGSIKKALAGLPGVNTTEIVFNEEEVRDHAIVTYDDALISDQQMIDAVHKLHNGQYKVMAITITKEVKSNGASMDNAPPGKEQAGVSVYSPGAVVLPSVLALLSIILRN